MHSIPAREGMVIDFKYWRYSSAMAYAIRSGEISMDCVDQQLLECLDEIDEISEGEWYV